MIRGKNGYFVLYAVKNWLLCYKYFVKNWLNMHYLWNLSYEIKELRAKIAKIFWYGVGT